MKSKKKKGLLINMAPTLRMFGVVSKFLYSGGLAGMGVCNGNDSDDDDDNNGDDSDKDAKGDGDDDDDDSDSDVQLEEDRSMKTTKRIIMACLALAFDQLLKISVEPTIPSPQKVFLSLNMILFYLKLKTADI